MNTTSKITIWIDLDNTPHVVFFIPIIRELKKIGYNVKVTVRDCFQVCGLADLHSLNYLRIGKHFGKNKIMKIAGLIIRSLLMIPFVLRERPQLALSHGSRSQLFLANCIGLKSILIGDYEYSSSLWITRPTWMMVPDVVARAKKIQKKFKRLLSYPGIKEDVYVPDFKPDGRIKQQLNIADQEIIITIRPPATEAHYFKPESEELFKAVIHDLSLNPMVRMVLLPRNENQYKYIKAHWPDLVESRKIIVPGKVVDGLNLIWHSDLVISGGGTMNREAAALNMPVYSIFRGDIGAVDNYLAKQNRLVLVEDAKEIQTKICIQKRKIPTNKSVSESATLTSIVNSIVTIIKNPQDALRKNLAQ